LGDTVKPRLVQSGADCGRVIVIDESEKELSHSDLRIEQAITLTGAKLFILDPLQAYLGADVDMHRANEIRPDFVGRYMVIDGLAPGDIIELTFPLTTQDYSFTVNGLPSSKRPTASRPRRIPCWTSARGIRAPQSIHIICATT